MWRGAVSENLGRSGAAWLNEIKRTCSVSLCTWEHLYTSVQHPELDIRSKVKYSVDGVVDARKMQFVKTLHSEASTSCAHQSFRFLGKGPGDCFCTLVGPETYEAVVRLR